MKFKVVTPPIEEPVSVDELKDFLRVNGTDDDTLVTSLGKAARERCEDYCSRAFLTQTIDLALDCVPRRDVVLPRAQELQSVTSVTFYDDDNASTVMSASDYLIDDYSEPGRIVLVNGATWPAVTLRAANGIIIRYIVGWEDADSVPEAVKTAIKQTAQWVYDGEDGVPQEAQHNLLPYRRLML